jgi:hypothetical protein
MIALTPLDFGPRLSSRLSRLGLKSWHRWDGRRGAERAVPQCCVSGEHSQELDSGTSSRSGMRNRSSRLVVVEAKDTYRPEGGGTSGWFEICCVSLDRAVSQGADHAEGG